MYIIGLRATTRDESLHFRIGQRVLSDLKHKEMSNSHLAFLLFCIVPHNTVISSRPNQDRTPATAHNSRLSHYLTSHGRIRPYQWLNDDNNLDIPGDEHLQGDGTHYHGENMLGDGVQQHVMDAEDPEIQRHICCSLGRAQAVGSQNCNVRHYIRIARESLRVQESSHDTEQFSSTNSGSGKAYRCILRHRHSFTKCCHTARISNHDHHARRLHRHHSS